MDGTTMRGDLTVGAIFRRGRDLFPSSEVVSLDDGRRFTFAQVAARSARLASALTARGLHPGAVLATLAFNHRPHLEAYFAVPCAGAVLLTCNVRLPPEQIAYVLEDAGARMLLTDVDALPLLDPVADRLRDLDLVVVAGDVRDRALPQGAVAYEDLLEEGSADFAWPGLDEGCAASLCYTSGTTGTPKGVAYSHRGTWLHANAVGLRDGVGMGVEDRALLLVPMFHAAAWGAPYGAWMTGADLILPGRHLDPASVARAIRDERATYAGAVPTVWLDLLRWGETHELDLSSLRRVHCGGSAVPLALVERLAALGVDLMQGWGMTETGPIAALSIAPKGTPAAQLPATRLRTRPQPGVEVRVVTDDGQPLPWDGESVGEIEVRGLWVTGSYLHGRSPDSFRDGWLRTGDVGVIHPGGYVSLTDRLKDVVKSGGEWISSVELENLLLAHPDVADAAVVAIPDERWQERPLACVVTARPVTAAALRAHLRGKVQPYWVPESWAFLDAVPRTGVGKADKKELRARHAADAIAVERCTDFA